MSVSLTRVGTCPICGGRVERSYTDIFFPYCGYTCKRVVQKKEERKEKEKIRKQMMLCESREQHIKELSERKIEKKEKDKLINQIKSRLN